MVCEFCLPLCGSKANRHKFRKIHNFARKQVPVDKLLPSGMILPPGQIVSYREKTRFNFGLKEPDSGRLPRKVRKLK
ncbi:hypothetical protein RP20_CCG016001 [Aedes albopictus]|nr:hypothetical protein RP20_CCG016001 [Aedes albopictus]